MQVSLRPLPSSQLLLVVQTQGSLGCRPVDPGVTLPRHLRPLLLRPLGLPALLLGPYTTTQPQDSQLSLNFEAALGSAWVGGRSERRLKIQLLDETFTDWSVYWVPLPDGQLEIQTLSPAQVALAWQQRQGVVTIWPTHLSHDLTLGSSVLKSKRRTPPILTDLPTTEDLMDVASSIFDLYSSQRDPPATVTPEAEEVSGLHADTSEQVRNPQSAVDGKKSDPHKSQEGSDIDDLFSAASDSPSPPIPLEPVEPEQWDINELFDPSNDDGHVYLGDDVVMASPSRQMDTIADADNAEQVEVTDNNLVTEDDFNFFDSPAAADNALQPASEEVLPHEIMSVRAPDPAETTARPTDGSIGNDDTEIEPSAETQHHRSPTPALSTPPPAQKRKREQPPSSLKSNISLKRQAHDLIPISFNPISLVSAPVFPAFPYDPPTPAPTPETLRPELVDRLRGSKKAKYDYTAAWTMESDSSEVDEDEDQTYVPPTPVSEADTEDLQSTKHPPTPHEGSGSLADFEYGGGTCIGAEWLRLKDTPEVAKIMSRPWNAAWVEGGYGSSCSAVAKTALRPDNHRLDLLSLVQSDRFACEVLANRHFRALFITTLEHSTASERPTEEPLLWEGVTLGNLVDSGEFDLNHLYFTDLSRYTRR